MIVRVLLAFLALGLSAPAEAKKQTYLTLYGEAPKYQEGFTHFEYVNPAAPKGGVLRLAAIGTFDSLNPFIVKGDPAAGMAPLHPSLLYVTLLFTSHEEPIVKYCYAAESVDLADDHRSVTFVLRPEATFHDGSPITADDVVFSFNQLRTKGNPLYRNYYGDVTAVVKVDERTIRFEFKDDTNRELPLILGEFPIISKTYYTAHSFESADLKVPLGNGPYRIKSVDPGHQIVYERVKGWWGENLPVNRGRYNFDRVMFQYYRDIEIAFEAFKSGAYDFRQEGRITNWMQRYTFPAVVQGKVKKLEVPNRAFGVMNGLIFNIRRPIFKDRRVRQALVEAFDFAWVNKIIFFGKYKQCHSYFSGTELASTPHWTPAEEQILKPYAAQIWPEVLTKPFLLPKTDGTGENRQYLRKAKALLAEAGWVIRERRLVHNKTGEPFVFEIMLQQAEMVRGFQDYIQSLKTLGIEVQLRLVETAQYMSRLNTFDFDAIFLPIGQSLSPGNEQREFWSSKAAQAPGSRNYAGIQDPVIDALIEGLIDAKTRSELISYTKALDRTLLWGYYVLPMQYSDVQYFALWNHIVPTKTFSDLHFDVYAFWSASAAQQKRP